MKLSLLTSTLGAYTVLCFLSATLLHAQEPQSTGHAQLKPDVQKQTTAQTQQPHTQKTPSPTQAKIVYENAAAKAGKQREYIKVYREAISLIMSAEDVSLSPKNQWMAAAGSCQRAIVLLPKLKGLSQGLSPSDLPKANLGKAVDQVCGKILNSALSQLDAKQCKAYQMLRRAYDYFKTRDSAAWAPRLRKLAHCR